MNDMTDREKECQELKAGDDYYSEIRNCGRDFYFFCPGCEENFEWSPCFLDFPICPNCIREGKRINLIKKYR